MLFGEPFQLSGEQGVDDDVAGSFCRILVFGLAGKSFRTEACTILEVLDGRVKRAWRFADTLGMLRQLGLMGGD